MIKGMLASVAHLIGNDKVGDSRLFSWINSIHKLPGLTFYIISYILCSKHNKYISKNGGTLVILLLIIMTFTRRVVWT